ncbi:unnamed protein product [Heligmosomoides polygyrus]|uniref:GATA zinc finger domain-containing protein 14-like n=1 Tax=Heligmosomoides polygyrus TaxID=6339 RepID=A0A183FF73_HELPZ|nr:unnamed protein product [Heligmosomoides polygyrus]
MRTTREIEDESMMTAFWGTDTYLRSVVTLKEGEIASFDGQSLISSLANTVNCTLADGYCVTDEDITIWQPLPWTPRCRYVPTGTYGALVTTQYAIIPALDTAFEFSSDETLQGRLTHKCNMRSPHLTTSLHILTFPLLTEYASLLEAIQNASSKHDRRKRALQHYATDNKGKQVPLDIIAKERTPLIKRIFGVDKLEDIPNFSTQPITDICLMTEIKRWNVTNSDLMRRARYYKPEEPRINVLRTIRYCYHNDYLHNDDDNLHSDPSSIIPHLDYSSSNLHPDHSSSNLHPDHSSSNLHPDHLSSNLHLEHPFPNFYPDHYPTNLHPDHSRTNFYPNHSSTNYVETYPTHDYGHTHVIYNHPDYENYNDERHHYIYAQNNHSS